MITSEDDQCPAGFQDPHLSRPRAALKAVPSLRTEAAAVAKTLGASKYGVGGEAR